MNFGMYNLCIKRFNTIRESSGQADIRDILTLKFRDHDVYMLPFLALSASLFDYSGIEDLGQDYKAKLCQILVYNKLSRYVTYDDITKKYKIDVDIIYSMIPNAEFVELTWATLLCFALDPVQTFKLFVFSFSRLMDNVFRNGSSQEHRIVFNAKGICNTQAFSFYLTVYFMFKLDPLITYNYGRHMKHMRLMNILDETCPVGCLMDEYLSGKITSSEMKKRYSKAKDGEDCVFLKEYYSLLTNGDYDGGEIPDFAKHLIYEQHNAFCSQFVTIINNFMGFAWMCTSRYQKLLKQVEENEIELDKQHEKINELYGTVSAKNERIKTLENENAELRAEVDRYTGMELDISDVEKYKSEASQHKDTLLKAEGIIASREGEIFELKRVISAQKKQIKKLNKRMAFCESVMTADDIVLENEICEEIEASMEVCIEFLSDKHIFVVGCPENTMGQRLYNMGLSGIKYYDDKRKRMEGKCDAGVILTRFAPHALIYSLEKFAGDSVPIVYFNGSNPEKLVYELYEELKTK